MRNGIPYIPNACSLRYLRSAAFQRPDRAAPHPEMVRAGIEALSEGAERTADGYGYGVSLLREPEAGNPHIRFDERDVETEHGEASEAPANERAGNR